MSDTTTYAFDSANRLTTAGGQAYTNDADGNTLTGGGRTNAWDSQNRLTQCVTGSHTSAYTYGADGLRRSSQVDGGSVTRYAYDGQTMVRELQTVGGVLTPAATYLTGPRGMEYRRDDGTGVVKWYVYDDLGSVVGELDPSGNLTAGKKYDVYGAERSGGTGTASSRQGYVGSLGHVVDAETGLIYMRARYYDPNVGRFISQDPRQHGDNWLVYCDNNPINKVDPKGEMPEWLEYIEHGLLLGLAGAGFIAVFAGLLAGLGGAAAVFLVIGLAMAVGAVVVGLGELLYGVGEGLNKLGHAAADWLVPDPIGTIIPIIGGLGIGEAAAIAELGADSADG